MWTKGEIFTKIHFKEILRGSLLEKAVLFRFKLSQISQQLRLGNQAHAPTQTRILMIFLWANISSTRRVKSCTRGTCKARTEQLFIISMIRAYTDFHTYVLGVLFKAWNIFCLLFIYFVFYFILSFLMTQTNYFFRTQDERTGQMTYLDTLASPQAWMKLSRSTILADFFWYAM